MKHSLSTNSTSSTDTTSSNTANSDHSTSTGYTSQDEVPSPPKSPKQQEMEHRLTRTSSEDLPAQSAPPLRYIGLDLGPERKQPIVSLSDI